jgi:hypothetical protein
MTGWFDGAAIMAWNLGAWVLWGAATVQVCRAPAERFVHGWRTKVGRLLIIWMVSISIGGLFLPLGAAIVLAGLRRARRQEPPPLGLAPPRGPQLPH